MSAAENDPIIEAHRIVAESERRIPWAERLDFVELMAKRGFRRLTAHLRGWWATCDYSVKQLVWMICAVALSEILTRIIRHGGI